MSVYKYKVRFNKIMLALSKKRTPSFPTRVESCYEVLTLGELIMHYVNIHGTINKFHYPTHKEFLSKRYSGFKPNRSFKIEFKNNTFYFAKDVQIWGIDSANPNGAIPITLAGSLTGILFEIDVIVVDESYDSEIKKTYKGYPAPKHIDCIVECKHGGYKKTDTRSLIGIRRHVSFLRKLNVHSHTHGTINDFVLTVANSAPPIPMYMVRPNTRQFIPSVTKSLYDIKEVTI